jgi:hypothetical protein
MHCQVTDGHNMKDAEVTNLRNTGCLKKIDSVVQQTAYLLKLVIPKTNVLPRWRLNVETKTKRTLHSGHRLSFDELTNAKNLVFHSSHFALN